MKIKRNQLCPCGSHKQYRHCCMLKDGYSHSELAEGLINIANLNPNLSIDELNIIAQHKMKAYNQRPIDDFCGLSPTQMSNWLYDDFDQLQHVTISTPNDLSSSPVMRYLQLIIDFAMQNDGSFAATKKGNLPAKLVKQANDLLPHFAVAQYATVPSISDFAGNNEDKFNALHYTHVLAKITGIIYLRSGHFHVKKSWQKQYRDQGISACFKPMLQTAIYHYNWSYFHGFENDHNLPMYWLFMLWRLYQHGSFEQLMAELTRAHPQSFPVPEPNQYWYQQHEIYHIAETCYINHFLAFWGFATMDPRHYYHAEAEQPKPRQVHIQPLCKQAFVFDVGIDS